MPRPSRTLIVGAAALFAVMLAGGVGVLTLLTHKAPPSRSAVQGRRLTLELGRADSRADVSKPMRCFVEGRNVGDLSIPDCAARNGVDPKALDLGLDRSGVMSAGQDAGLTLAPPVVLTPTPALSPIVLPELQPAASAGATSSLAPCLAYGPSGWGPVGEMALGDMALGACVRRLFEGRCERPGEALYGRWADRTVRLVPGRVEISSDNRSFRPLASQGPGCSLPPV